MFQCTFDNDSGEYALAKRQAEEYPDGNPESKIKGNMAEIEFQALCRQILPLDKWHWHNGESIRKAEREWNDHDFTVLNRTVDVKARSDINKIFQIDPDEIDSDIVVLAWVPPEVTEAIIESDSIRSLRSVHPREHDPVTILGWIESEKLNPPETRLSNPAQGTEIKIQHLDTANVVDTPIGANLNSWLSDEEYSIDDRSGVTSNHTDKEGDRLHPGAIVEYRSDDKNNLGVVVDCPFVPANCEFDEELREYSGSRYDPSDPSVGITHLDAISEEEFEDIHQLAWDNLYPAIRGYIPDDTDVYYTRSSSVTKREGISRLSHPISIPDY